MNMNWDNIKKDDLERLYYDEHMSDSMIADRFGVTKNQVAYKRRKYGVSIKNKIFLDFLVNQDKVIEKINNDSKEYFIKNFDLDSFSKAITHFIFRNGPVEDIHADGKLTDEDMKILNKFMVNRIAGLINLIMNNEWIKLQLAYSYYKLYGSDWDKVEPDTKEIEELYSIEINKAINSLKNNDNFI